MLRKFTCLALFGASLLAPVSARAQAAVLLAVADATQLSELQLAKVMADDSSLWVSVRVQGRTRLALVSELAGVEPASAGDAWLRALDFATRVRVAAPPGPLTGCASSTRFEPVDSGFPELGRVAALELASANSELELRRWLADAELPVDVGRIAQFTSHAQPPYRLALYDVPALGGSTEALRLVDRGHPAQLPPIVLSGAKTLPISLIALAEAGVLPFEQESADASEFPVAYRALELKSDYLSARGAWLAQNPTRWLNEVQASAALFTGTVLPAGEAIAPVVSRYFADLSGVPAGSCEAQVRAARARASVNAADFACGGADDLARSLSEVGFADLRLSRFFGMASDDGTKFRVAPSVPRSPFLHATDFDQSGCPAEVALPANVASDPSDSRTPPVSTPVVSAPDDPYYTPTPGRAPEGSSTVTVVNSNSNDSCSGNSSSSESSNDSCSGNSSSSESSSDSCSGDSSSSESSSDSCSGDSSSSESSSDSCSGDSSSDDSAGDSCSGDSSSDDSGADSCSGDSSDSSSDGCSGDSDSSSDSSSDADACSSNSAPGNAARKSATLRSGKAAAHRPRQVRLSLLTLLAAALALPLRRLRASR